MTGATTARAVGAALLAGVLLGFAGCELYVPAEDISRADIIQLQASPATGLSADGRESLTLIVDVDTRTSTGKDITVTTSDGVVDFSVAPDDIAARTVVVRAAPGSEDTNEPRKFVDVPMVVGRTPGEVFLSAAVAGVAHQIVIELGEALPDLVVLSSNLTAANLDGASRVDVSATLLRNQGEVSFGTRVAWAVCCDDGRDSITQCPGRTPLRVPSITELQRGDTITVTAVSERISAAEQGNPDSFDALVIAAPLSAEQSAPTCTGAIADHDLVRVRVTPLP